MQVKNTIKLPLTDAEKKQFRLHKIKVRDVASYTVEQLCEMLEVPMGRAQELRALAEFQRIPSVGLKFAGDLVDMGYYSLAMLKSQRGPTLLNAHEKLIGYPTDPCVEDQFWLVVHFANYQDYSKSWWDFTLLRKAYRHQHGYPADRPQTVAADTLADTEATPKPRT